VGHPLSLSESPQHHLLERASRHLLVPGSGGPEGRHAALRLPKELVLDMPVLFRPDEIHPVGGDGGGGGRGARW